MPSTVVLSSWDTLLLMLPFGILLVCAMLGLDGQIATPRRRCRKTWLSELNACELNTAGKCAEKAGKALNR